MVGDESDDTKRRLSDNDNQAPPALGHGDHDEKDGQQRSDCHDCDGASSPLAHKQLYGDAGDGYHCQQNTADVYNQFPAAAGIPTGMEGVHNPNEALLTSGQLVVAGSCVEEQVGGVPGGAVVDEAVSLFKPEVHHLARNSKVGAGVFANRDQDLRTLSESTDGFRGQDPGGIGHLLVATDAPIRMVERYTGNTEEQHQHQAEHAGVHVNPPNPKVAFPLQGSAGA